MKYVRCIKEFKSQLFPEENYGMVGSVYRVEENPWPTALPHYFTLAELTVGYVNVERFEDVVVIKDTI